VTSRRLFTVFRFAFAGAALLALFGVLRAIGFDVVARQLALVGWGGGLLLLGLGALEAALDAQAFFLALRVPTTRRYLYVANQAGALVNRFIPLDTGEVLKGALLARRMPTQDAVAATVIWNYAFKLAKPVAALISLVVAFAAGGASLHRWAGLLVLASALSFLPWAGMKLLITVGLGRIFTAAVRILRLPVKDPEGLVEKARGLDDGVRAFRRGRPGRFEAILFWQVLGRACSWVSYAYVMSVLQVDLDVSGAGVVWAGFMVMGYLIALLPSRLGTTEAGGFVLFKFLGLDPALGLTTQLVLSIRAVLVNGLSAFGLVFFPAGARHDPPPAPDASPPR